MSKINISTIAEELFSDGWKVLSATYKNLDSELEFECPEGHHVFMPWKKLRGAHICPICSKNQFSNLQDNAEIIPKKKGAYRILALDQASHTTGYTIMDDGQVIKYGTFVTNLNNEIERDNMIKMWLVSMIQNWKPDFVGLEGIQYQAEVAGGPKMGITVFQTLARLQGILMECCYEQKVAYDVVSTNTWRHSCGVKGQTRADKKRSMQLLIKDWYDISVVDDIADSIGIARYFANTVGKSQEITCWEI